MQGFRQPARRSRIAVLGLQAHDENQQTGRQAKPSTAQIAGMLQAAQARYRQP